MDTDTRSKTYQSEELEEVDVSVQFILNLLKSLWGEGTHGIMHTVHPPPTRENDEAFQQNLTARYLLQTQIGNPKSKLEHKTFSLKHSVWKHQELICVESFCRSGMCRGFKVTFLKF